MQYNPYEYQTYCIERILDDDAVGLFLRPGLGKTSITLTAINVLRNYRWQIRKALVIAPKKVAEGTWSKEAAKWDHLQSLRVVPVLGSEKKRMLALGTPADVYVINRENVPWLVDYYRQQWPFDMVVVDESTSFKSPAAKRFKALRLVRRYMRKVVLLTGTPVSHGIEDLWSQIYLLDEGKRLGRTVTAFRQQYFTCNTHGGHYVEYTAKADAERQVLDAISDLCVSMTAEDYLQLPDCVEHEVPVVLSDRQAKAYKAFEREMLIDLDEETITAASAAVLTGKLLQFCAGAIYDADKKAVAIHDEKLAAYMELLEELDGAPCLTFYGFQHDRDRLQETLKKAGKRVRVYSGPADEDAWNAGELDVLLAHPASCAYGLNLQQGGQHVVWYTPTWSFEMNDQARCRLWRQGSPYDRVFVHYLTCTGTVDEDVLAAVRSRTDTHNAAMQILKARIEKAKGAVA